MSGLDSILSRATFAEQLDGVTVAGLLEAIFVHFSSDLAPPGKGSVVSTDKSEPSFLVPLRDKPFNFGTDEAVAKSYIEEATKVVDRLPRGASMGMLDDYINGSEKQGKSRANPFGLFHRPGLYFHDWLTSVNGPSSMYRDHYTTMQPWYQKHVNLLFMWNVYHIGYLKSLNVPGSAERKQAMDTLGSNLFNQTEAPLRAIAPYDNPVQWMIFNALSVVLSAEPRITPVARYRAIETLSDYPIAELIDKFMKTEIQQSNGKAVACEEYKSRFSEEFCRLPRSFWSGQEERSQNIHKNWRDNPKIVELFGEQYSDTADYTRAFNMLVTKHPRETLHVSLLLMSELFSAETDAGFKALVALGKLDPVSAGEIFGYGASYLSLAHMPSDDFDRILEGIGVAIFDYDAAAQYQGLPAPQLLQVIRRLSQRTNILEEQLTDAVGKRAYDFFQTAGKREVLNRDPKGYYRLLGVHPDTDPEDFQIVLKVAYRRLAQKYHTDMREKPDLVKMKALNEAYEVLNEIGKRQKYDPGFKPAAQPK